jgi:S1-C subfamily serine protease
MAAGVTLKPGAHLTPAPSSAAGTAAAILGFPGDGPFDVRAARLGPTETVVTSDAYGRGPIDRQVTTLRGVIRPGNSGGPVVDAAGRVLTTIFATTTSGPAPGFGVPNGIVARALARAAAPVGTDACAA